MSVPSAELTAPTVRSRSANSTAGISERLAGGRFYLVLVAVALALGGLSLLIPSTPSYDPWAWLVWGREIIHLNLQTTGGPSWKPLPMIFTIPFSLFGGAAPDLWLVVARAGAVVAVVMVFKLSVRLVRQLAGPLQSGASRWDLAAAWAPALMAGLIAAIGLAFSGGFISDNALGYSEGLMTATVLIAVERHLDGQRRQAFAISFLAALDRPEIWLFWGPYGLWLFWKDPGARKLVIGLFVLIPVLWFLPEYWGSGHFLRGVSRAQHPRSNSPAFAKCPFCTELADHAWPTVLLRIKAVAAVAVVAAAWLLWRANRARAKFTLASPRERAMAAVIACGVLGVGWWVVIGVMTQAGFSGNNRYLVLGAALIEIAGGVGWGWAALELGRAVPRVLSGARSAAARIAAGLAAVAVLAVAFLMIPSWVGGNLIDIPRTHRALVYQAHLREDMSAAVKAVGGASRVLACGSVMTEGFQVPMLAYNLDVHTLAVAASPVLEPGQAPPPPPNVIFQTRAQRNAHLLPLLSTWPNVDYRLVTHNRTFRVYEHCRVT